MSDRYFRENSPTETYRCLYQVSQNSVKSFPRSAPYEMQEVRDRSYRV